MRTRRGRRPSAGLLGLFVLIAVVAIGAACPAGLAAQARPASPRHFLWKVQSATGVLYLAGSIHALPADSYPLPPPFEQAFAASGSLVEEIDLGSAMALDGPALLARGIFQDGRTFASVVSKETAAMVTSHLKDSPLPPAMIQPMKPWLIMVLLGGLEARQAGLDAGLGLDKYFFDKATQAGKAIVGLETAESQIERFDRMPLPTQEQMLRTTLGELATSREQLTALVTAWRQGDAPGLETRLLASFRSQPEAYASLVVERNRNWMPQIEACMQRPSPCFVVVGAAHLVGTDGLVAMLQRKGYRVEQQ